MNENEQPVTAPDRPGAPDGAPVICADQTIGDGLVVRWRHSAEGPAVVSASRNAVMIHGTVTVTEDLKEWIRAAEEAYEMLREGRRDEAKALATHEYDRAFLGDLVPVGSRKAAGQR